MKLKHTAALMAAALMMCASGLAHAANETFVKIEAPAKGSQILVAKPNVTLSLLMASGMSEVKSDWSQSASANFAKALAEQINAKTFEAIAVDPEAQSEPRAVQISLLNDAVTDSISYYSSPIGRGALPSKTDFEWTVGHGAEVFSRVPNVDPNKARYVLFLSCTGDYASSGRAAAAVVGAAFGVGMRMGLQYIRATLVDVKTGQVVWYKLDVLPPGKDVRTEDGAKGAVETLFKTLPL